MARRASHLLSGVVGGLVVLLGLALVPAVAGAGDPATQTGLSPGSPLQAGRVNQIDASTWIRGTAPNGNLRLANDGNGPALQLNTQAGRAPLTVNSKGRVDQLNADLLDSLHADQIVRVASTASEDAPDAPGGTHIALLTTIAAPRTGYLVVQGSVMMSHPAGMVVHCYLQSEHGHVPGSWRTVVLQAGQPEDCSSSGVLRTSGARTHDVRLYVRSDFPVSLREGSLYALFTPFGANG